MNTSPETVTPKLYSNGQDRPDGVALSLEAFIADRAPWNLVAYMAMSMAGIKADDVTTWGKSLEEILECMKPILDREEQLDRELKNPTFAHTYRHCYSDAALAYRSIISSYQEFPHLKLLKNLKGLVALDIISHYADSFTWALSERKFKYEIEDSKPYGKIRTCKKT